VVYWWVCLFAGIDSNDNLFEQVKALECVSVVGVKYEVGKAEVFYSLGTFMVTHHEVLEFFMRLRVIMHFYDCGVKHLAYGLYFFLEPFFCFERGIFIEYFERAQGSVGVVCVIDDIDGALPP